MPTKSEVKTQFLRDVERHQMTIIRDDGDYRHLRLQRPATGVQYFDLLTWNGHLCFTGDMGTYVFSRVPDMFTFFRQETLVINPEYWSEKVLARDRDGIQEWSPKRFREVVSEHVHEYFDGDPEELAKAIEELSAEVLPYAHEEWEASSAYLHFRYEGFQPEAEELMHCYEYTFRFLWCCYAIVWGIQQYDHGSYVG